MPIAPLTNNDVVCPDANTIPDEKGIHMRIKASLLAIAMIPVLCWAAAANAQTERIDAGTTIQVRTTEDIEAEDSDGRMFDGVVERDILSSSGTMVVPRGSDVDLVVKEIGDTDLALDLESIAVGGQRYTLQSEESVVGKQRTEGIGVNRRTGVYVGGGPLLGAIIGGIAGGGKGAAVGTGAGAAGGAGVQILTRGSSVKVPAESLLTFRLQQTLQTSTTARLKPGYQSDSGISSVFQSGVMAGQADAERGLAPDPQNGRWNSGYNRGYSGGLTVADLNPATGTISVGADHYVMWNASPESRVYVSVDNGPEQPFAETPWGSQ